MNRKYPEEQKVTLISRYLSGEAVSSIVETEHIPRSTIYFFIQQHQQSEQASEKQTINMNAFRKLESKVQHLEGIVEILKTVECPHNASLTDKLYALEALYGKYSVHMLCEALDVPRGTFYNHILRNKRDNTWYSKRREELRLKIREIYDDSNQIFGAEKIVSILKSGGYKTSCKMVRELMRDMGLISICQDAKSFYDKEKRSHKNYLNQQFNATKPNQVWVSDITYFRCNEKTYYICAVIDLFARMIVGYKISKRNSTQLTKSTFCRHTNGEIQIIR